MEYVLTAQTDATNPLYLWSRRDTVIRDSTATLSSVSGNSQPITYFVMVIDTGNNKCATNDSMIIAFAPNPIVPIINNGMATTACDSSTVEFDVSNAQVGINYIWSSSPALPISGTDAAQSNITFATTDSAALIMVTAVSADYGCSASTQQIVTLHSGLIPSVSIIETADLLDSTLIAVVQSDTTVSYQWGYYDGSSNNIISGATAQDLLLDSSQNSAQYWVIVTDTIDHCSTKTYFIPPVTTLGIKGINGADVKISVYPNPSDGIYNVSINTDIAQDWSVAVMDINGKLIGKHLIGKTQSPEWIIHAETWSAGAYILQVVSQSGDTKSVRLIRK
jgi:hypothetical protein